MRLKKPETVNTRLMKKAVGFFWALAVLLGLSGATPRSPLTYFDDAAAEVYYTYRFESKCPCVDLGQGCLVYCSVNEVADLPQDYFAVSVITTAKEWQKTKKILRVCELTREKGENFSDSLCFSPRLTGGVKVDGETVNSQVAQVGDRVKIGFPLIVGSF